MNDTFDPPYRPLYGEIELVGTLSLPLMFVRQEGEYALYSTWLTVITEGITNYVPCSISTYHIPSELVRILVQTINDDLRNDKLTRVHVYGQLRSRRVSCGNGDSGYSTMYVQIKQLYFADTNTPDCNKVKLECTVEKPLLYRTTTTNGDKVCRTLTLVERGTHHYHIPCSAWNNQADVLGSARTGDHCSIKGRFASRDYMKLQNDGSRVKRQTYEVIVTHCDIIEEGM